MNVLFKTFDVKVQNNAISCISSLSSVIIQVRVVIKKTDWAVYCIACSAHILSRWAETIFSILNT